MRKRALIALMALATTACGYNRIQQLDETAQQAKQGIDVQLQRRADLIPNLVNVVKGYAAHEETVFREVAQARSGLLGAMQSGDIQATANANAALSGALGRLIAVSERYPTLKANENFLDLQAQLEGTENRISTARNDYNEAVRTYNAYIRSLPQSITAKVIGAKTRPYFEVTNAAAQNAPTVDFSQPSSGKDTVKH